MELLGGVLRFLLSTKMFQPEVREIGNGKTLELAFKYENNLSGFVYIDTSGENYELQINCQPAHIIYKDETKADYSYCVTCFMFKTFEEFKLIYNSIKLKRNLD